MKVRVIKGTVGIVEKLPDGRNKYSSKSRAHGPFEIDAEQAKRLIGLGVAEKVVESLEKMTVNSLKEYANDEGIDLNGCRTKADFISRIRNAENEMAEEAEKEETEAETESDEDDAPAFDAADALV